MFFPRYRKADLCLWIFQHAFEYTHYNISCSEVKGCEMLVLVMCIALFCGHFIKGVTGFGSALVSIPIMSFVFPPAEAIVIALMCDVCIGGYLTWMVRKTVLWGVLPGMIVGAVGGQQTGVSIQKILAPDDVRICMAIVITIFALRMLYGAQEWKKREYAPMIVGGIAGFGAGLMSGLVGSSGPPVVLYTTSYYDKEEGRSLLIAFFFFSAITLILTMLYTGMVAHEVFSYGSVGIVVSLLAANMGSWVAPRITQSFFVRLVAGLLLLCSLSMLLVVYIH